MHCGGWNLPRGRLLDLCAWSPCCILRWDKEALPAFFGVGYEGVRGIHKPDDLTLGWKLPASTMEEKGV